MAQLSLTYWQTYNQPQENSPTSSSIIHTLVVNHCQINHWRRRRPTGFDRATLFPSVWYWPWIWSRILASKWDNRTWLISICDNLSILRGLANIHRNEHNYFWEPITAMLPSMMMFNNQNFLQVQNYPGKRLNIHFLFNWGLIKLKVYPAFN